RARADWWNGPDGSVYDLRRRNCITFVADLARLAGLQTAEEPSMKPGTFPEATAALNPEAAWNGQPAVSQASVEHPAPAAQTPEPDSAPVVTIAAPAAR